MVAMRERATALGGKDPRGSAAQTDGREELRVTEAGNGATSTNGRCRRRSERGTDAATKREKGNSRRVMHQMIQEDLPSR